MSLTLVEQETEWSVFAPEGSMHVEPFIPDGPEPFDIQFDAGPDIEHLHMELRGMEKALRQQEDQLRKSIQTMVRVRQSRSI